MTYVVVRIEINPNPTRNNPGPHRSIEFGPDSFEACEAWMAKNPYPTQHIWKVSSGGSTEGDSFKDDTTS